MRGSYTGPGKGSDPAKAARVAEQKKVMQALQGGGGITAYSANPLVAGIERLGNIFAGSQQPTVYASKLGGREVLQAAGGWNPASQPANINVAGRTWDLARSGNEAVYLPRSGGTLAAVTPSLNTSDGGGGGGDTRVVVEERNYQAEKARAAQLAEQDQLSKKYRVADLTKAYNAAQGEEKEKLGLEIWATTNPQLAAKLKPGQLGYTEASSAFMSASPLGSYVKSVGDMQFANKTAFPTEPLSTAGFSLETPISGINLPTGLDQVGVSERFANVSPATMNAAMSVFSDPLKFFKPDLTQTQQSLLRQAFEKGLK